MRAASDSAQRTRGATAAPASAVVLVQRAARAPALCAGRYGWGGRRGSVWARPGARWAARDATGRGVRRRVLRLVRGLALQE